MAPPRLVFILVSVLTLTFFLTFISLTRSHSKHYTATGSTSSIGHPSFRSLFSFRTPSALFPSSAIISLTDDNSTFFLSRPADFGPSLPPDGLSAQLWVGSGFGDDNLGRGLATETEGELGCSDVPGWRNGRKHHQGDSQFEPAKQVNTDKRPNSLKTLDASEHRESLLHDLPTRGKDDLSLPTEDDGTDDYLHHPLPASQVRKPTAPGQAADADHHPSGQPSQHADIQSLQESAEISGKLVLLSRGGCGFLEKVKWVQRRGGVGLIVGDNTRGGALVTMYARGDTSNVTIPALFTSRTTAHLLSSLIPPDGAENDDAVIESSRTEYSEGAQMKPNNDRPTFTPTGSISRTTSTSPMKAHSIYTEDMATKQARPHEDKKGWFRFISGLKAKKHVDLSEDDAKEDSRRPPSSGRLTWVNEQWTESAISPGKDKQKSVQKDSSSTKSSQDHSQIQANAGDGFEIGVHDWRDPDLVVAEMAKSPTSTTASTSTRVATFTGLTTHGNVRSASGKGLSGGSITPSSGEYEKSSFEPSSQIKALDGQPSIPLKQDKHAPSRLSKILWGSGRDEATSLQHSENSMTSKSKIDGSTGNPISPQDHQGLWITLTPTTVSTSPFFDTLLVLVVSPLITLTVVYSLLLIRSRIRRRRWRAPKSVVERLPIRTYHTMSCSSTTSSSQLSTPTASSPASPLLQSSPQSVKTRSRPRACTASGIGDAVTDSLDKATAKASLKQREPTSATATNAKRRQYHGKQVECVVCLEETPWLTTRRRTCPICKGDVVRSMAKPGNQSAKALAHSRRSDVDDPDDVQVQAAETSNDSPTAAIPIPRDAADLERGDDMAATLVNDPPEASSSRRGWHGLAAFSLSAFSGEAAWRQAQADRNR
ncbi:MAG: hypothetical protein Q9209_006910 [Squamulea sp. 1 TL-2023]